MAFNLGAFASGLAKGGIDTYAKFLEIDERKKADERAEKALQLQIDAAREAREEREGMRAAGDVTLGRVGQAALTGNYTQDAGLRAGAGTQADMLAKQTEGMGLGLDDVDRMRTAQTMRENTAYQNQPEVQARLAAGSSAGLPTEGLTRAALLPEKGLYTREQAIEDYATRVAKINPEKALQAEMLGIQRKGALQGLDVGKQGLAKGKLEIESLERDKRFNDDFDKIKQEWSKATFDLKQDVDKTFHTEGAAGVLKKYGKEFQSATGNTVQLVGNEIVVKKGDQVVDKFGADQLAARMEPMLAMKTTQSFMDTMVSKGMFKSTDQAMNFLKIQSDMRNQGITADAAMIKAVADQALVPSTAARNNAAAAASTAMSRMTNLSIENRAEAGKLVEKWNDLTPEEQTGPKGLALQREFNMLNVKAGATVPLGGTPRETKGGIMKVPVEQKKNEDGTYTAFAKDGGQALYNTINGEAIPLGMDAATYARMKQEASTNRVKLMIGEDSNGRLAAKFVGADGQFYDNVKEASQAKAAPKKDTAAPAATSTAPAASAIPTEAPTPKATVLYGKTKYTVPGAPGAYDTAEEAQAAWVRTNQPKPGRQY
jgi:hypothetical protein